MLNRFWSLSKNPFTPPSSPFLMGNIRLHGMPTTSFEKELLWKVMIQLPVFLFLVLHQFLYQQISFLELSRISFNITWQKFSSQIFLFNGFTSFPQPYPLIGLNLLNVTKVFRQFSRKCLMKYFFSKNVLTKSCKAFFKGSN